MTALMLVLSSRSAVLAQRIGPRIPLTVGPLPIAASMLLMTRIGRGCGYPDTVLPAVGGRPRRPTYRLHHAIRGRDAGTPPSAARSRWCLRDLFVH